jgi:hypothetical protein
MESGELKFKIYTFIKYLLIEPWSTKVSLPNYRTLNWILLYFAVFFRYKWLMIILLITGLMFHLIEEWRSQRYIDWYRSKKYINRKEALKKVREERKLNINTEDETRITGTITE